MWKGINGDIAWTLDAHYYLGCGNRGGREREIVYWVDEEKGQNVDKLGWSANRSNTNDEQCGRSATDAGQRKL